MKHKAGVVVFPGSNCDHDAYYAVKKILNYDATFLWHKDTDLQESDIIILPGGFSYGDYLRGGAIAKLSPIMNEVINFAKKGGLVIGICNGFQVLTETGLLPGVLQKNSSLKFIGKDIHIKTINNKTKFTNKLEESQVLKIPVAHGEGNYYTDDDTVKKLFDSNRVVFQYCSQNGEVSDEYNPNGSIESIAGIINEEGNILGLMPHPERCCDPVLRNTDGAAIFESVFETIS